MATVIELPVDTYKGRVEPDWCPGCGDYGVLRALQTAAGKIGIEPKDLLVVSGIGCSSNLPGFMHAYGIHSLHGRSIAVATGAHLANTDLKVVVTGGDGDGYGIGVGHFIHAMRRNLDMTYIVMDNQIYGLTTGQTSPTTSRGHKTKSTPTGNVETPLNPIALAITAGATYVARGFSGEQKHLVDLIAGGMAHRGFALIDVHSPCVTYNKVNTYSFFKERIYKLEDEGFDPSSLTGSFEKSFEWGNRIPIGIFYKAERPTYEEDEPVLCRGSLVKQRLGVSEKEMAEFVDEMV